MNKNNSSPPTQNHLYDGWVYRKLIDPSLAGIRRRVAKLVPEASRVIDAGCGTGDQLRHLAPGIQYGLGVDLSRVMVRTAIGESKKQGLDNCEFMLADASKLGHLEDQSFDIAMSSMVIHEMPAQMRLPVLNELKRLGKTMILVDWIFPQPSLTKRWGTHTIEFLAGREHYAGFRSFLQAGGMPTLLDELGVTVVETQITSKGTIQLWVCKA